MRRVPTFFFRAIKQERASMRGLFSNIGASAALICAGIVFAGPGQAAWGVEYFTNTTFVTQDGKTVHLFDDLLKGKQVVINFIYTKCGDSCPLETARLGQVQKLLGDRMGRDVFFYSFSIDPKRDTPAELKSYAQKYHAGPGWLFLTGKKSDIEMVRQKLGLAAHASENELTDHSTSLMIGNPSTGQWIRDSSTDNPGYIATIVRDWLGDWHKAPKTGSYAERPPLPAYVKDKGAYLFQSRCSACHTIGEGDSLGPDLRNVTLNRSKAWLNSFIADPARAMAKNDPIATALYKKYNELLMPDLKLSDVDLQALVGFLTEKDLQGRGKGRQTPTGTAKVSAQATATHQPS
jgi:protein SCO1/2